MLRHPQIFADMKDSMRLSLVLFPVFFGLLFTPGGDRSHATTFTVNSMYDLRDLSPGNGLCVAYLSIQPPFVFPFCTLRAAVEEANGLPGPDIVVLPEGIYLLGLEGAGEDASAAGDLDITDSLILAGSGQEKTFIDGMQRDRVLDIGESGISVTVAGITITNGLVPAYLPDGQKTGGGIRNSGTLVLKGVSLENNGVPGHDAGNRGGGLANQGTCSVDNSTLHGNSAGQGGAVANAAGSVLRISASTIYGNTAESGGGVINFGSVTAVNTTLSGNSAGIEAGGTGGAIRNWGEAGLVHCTIAGNKAVPGGGGICNDGVFSMVNTIVADNRGGNCRLGKSIDSRGHNLVSDGSCNLDEKVDFENVNPLLEALGKNGGMTLTHALRQNSPAIDAGVLLADVPVDQRGIRRPQRENADIGSYELPINTAPLFSPLLLNRGPSGEGNPE